MQTDMSALIERIEAASGADRELDALIWMVVTPGATRKETIVPDHEYDGKPRKGWTIDETREASGALIIVPTYSASIDDAMTLLDQYGVLLHLSDIGADGLPYARVGRPDLDGENIFSGISSGIAKDATPLSGLALALCAAALKARTATENMS